MIMRKKSYKNARLGCYSCRLEQTSNEYPINKEHGQQTHPERTANFLRKNKLMTKFGHIVMVQLEIIKETLLKTQSRCTYIYCDCN